MSPKCMCRSDWTTKTSSTDRGCSTLRVVFVHACCPTLFFAKPEQVPAKFRQRSRLGLDGTPDVATKELTP
jgi:hypothetical protein